jgi:hypothetical protein
MNAVYKWGWFGGANTDCGCDSLYAAYFGTGLLLSYLVRCLHCRSACLPLVAHFPTLSVPLHRVLHRNLQARCRAPAQGQAGGGGEEEAVIRSTGYRPGLEVKSIRVMITDDERITLSSTMMDGDASAEPRPLASTFSLWE